MLAIVRPGGRGRLHRLVVQTAPFLLLALLAAVGLLAPARAWAETLFGPRSFTLTTATPQTTSVLMSTPAGAAHLHVRNGAADGSARLSHASLLLNGVEVVSPRELGAHVALADVPVTLLATNLLTVTLSGPQNGTLEVTLEHRTASLTSVTPASGRQGEALTVTVVGSQTTFTAGTTQLWAGPGIRVGGAPAGEPGPVTVQDATHLTANLSIQPTAVLGPRTLLATTAGERAALVAGFTVLAGTPAIAGTTVTTWAGTGSPGLVDGPGATAQFRLPFDVAGRADGRGVVADTGNSRLRELAADGTVSTVALPVTLRLPLGVALDAAGRTVVADTANCVIRLVQADGSVTTIGQAGSCGFADGAAASARFKFPRDVVADAAGNLVVADAGNFRMRRIAPDGTVSTLAGSGAFGSADGPAATATFGLLSGVAVAPDGTVFVTDAVFHRIRQIDPAGQVTTVAGTGVAGFADGPAATAQFAFPTGLARDATGTLYVADTLNQVIRRLTPAGVVETLAGTGAPGRQDGPGETATFTLPAGLGILADAPGQVLVADTGSHTIRRLMLVPVVTGVSPASAVHGTTIAAFTVTGSNLFGATRVAFLREGVPDPAITATALTVSPDGRQLTAAVDLAATAALGPRTVTVTTPGGTSAAAPDPATTVTVLGRLTLVPTVQTLSAGTQGLLDVQLSAPAPAGGLTVALESAAPGIATVTSPVTLAAGAASAMATITAVAEGTTTFTASAQGFANGLAAVTVIVAPPAVTGFSPTSGVVGTLVTISGRNFDPVPSRNTARVNGTAAPVETAATTALTVRVPTGATTGPIAVTTPTGTATSTGVFIVLPTPDFALAASPASAAVILGSRVSYRVTLTAQGGFTGLVPLSVANLPPGASASVEPAALGPGGGAFLTITTTGTTPVGPRMLQVVGTVTLNGADVTRTATVSLDVQPAGPTALAGQVLDDQAQPLPGVSLTLGGPTLTTLGTTDAAGNFLLTNVPAGSQVILVDGSTANRPGVRYPTIPLTLNIQPGIVNQLGFTPHLTPQPTARLIPITPGQETVLTEPSIPGFRMTIPAGVQIIGWDGQANTQVGVTAVPIDRSPLPPPGPGETSRVFYLFSFGKVGGGVPTGNVPVDTPNDVDGLPGEKVDLYYFNEAPDGTAPNRWEQYGTGTVSSDGLRIVTDLNPATGKPYGMPRFCCGGRRNVPPPPPPRPGGGPSGGPGGPGPTGGDPVDLATGFLTLSKTDLVLPGIIPLVIERTYRTNLTNAGPFGLGTSWAYDIFLQPPPNGSTDALILFTPGNRQDLFALQPDGRFVNTTSPTLQGAAITNISFSGAKRLRFKDGREWRFNSVGLLLSQADRNGNTVTLARDSQGRVTQITQPGGRALTLSYTGTNLRIDRIQDPLLREVRYGYDAQGRLVDVTDPTGGLTRYTYDAAHRLLTITDARGITFLTNEYDPAGRVARQTQADGGVFTFSYTTTGSFISAATVTDPRGNATTTRFNSAGYPISVTDALGQTTRFERAPGTNVVVSTIDPLGRTSSFTYDGAGNLTSVTDPLGNVTRFAYEPTFNRVTSLTDALGNVTQFAYDAKGNLIATTDPLGARTATAYDAAGQPVSLTDASGQITSLEYDAVGNPTATVDPLGNRTTRLYDPASRLITLTDPRGATTTLGYDPLNRITQIQDPLNGSRLLTYDPSGNLTTVTDANGNVLTHTYDVMDQPTARTDALGRQERFAYDLNGNLVTVTDRNGQVSTFTYDPLDRLVLAHYADGNRTAYTYDAVGRVTTLTDSASDLLEWTYDAINRKIRETAGLTTIAYTYDSIGRRVSMTAGGQEETRYRYDAVSRLTQVSRGAQVVDLAYDVLGRRTRVTYPNGVITTFTYDAASRLTGITHQGPTAVIEALTYAYDEAGNRVSVGRTNGAAANLPAPAQAAYDTANQLVRFNSTVPNLTYDAAGNLTSHTDGTGTGTTAYTWDARNRLVGITGTALAAEFAYDALDRRTRKTVNGVSTTYLYDGPDVAAQSSGGSLSTYLRGLGVDEPFVRQGDSTEYYHADALGSVVTLSDGAGASRAQYTYEPFGATTLSGSSDNPLQFTARENDGTALYYYRQRYYSPLWGRFISRDPVYQPTTNPYGYAANNPVNRLDPFGLFTIAYRGGSGTAGSGKDIEDLAKIIRAGGEDVVVLNPQDSVVGWLLAAAAGFAGEPVNLFGHSLGGDAVVGTAASLAALGIPVANAVTIDSFSENEVSSNVQHNLNFFETLTPGFRGAPNSGAQQTQNVQIDAGHFDIPADLAVRFLTCVTILGGRKDVGNRCKDALRRPQAR